ncbi:hypothetical protein G5C65_34160 [Streptomyces sp. SB3404]|uniref:Uncharacterized protein n=1 Tax=Streptomyces boncukensis TaxID=2711219 RepID=A0A6G4X6X1_9ACTN|nr:hypothetical protein [Streptomyces boncukensis]
MGEQGPELVDLPAGARVRTSGDSRRLAAAADRGDGGRPIVIQLDVGGRALGEIVVDPLRREVRKRGGNVQAVLGQT